MNQKQLANVLIKILGLSMCAYSIAPIAIGIVNLFSNLLDLVQYNVHSNTWSYSMTGLLSAVIGVYLIIRSRSIADKLLKDE
jgi:hypothetical protein